MVHGAVRSVVVHVLFWEVREFQYLDLCYDSTQFPKNPGAASCTSYICLTCWLIYCFLFVARVKQVPTAGIQGRDVYKQHTNKRVNFRIGCGWRRELSNLVHITSHHRNAYIEQPLAMPFLDRQKRSTVCAPGSVKERRGDHQLVDWNPVPLVDKPFAQEDYHHGTPKHQGMARFSALQTPTHHLH